MAVVRILAQVVFVYKQILHHLRQELHGKRCVCFTLKTVEVQCVDIFFGGVVVALISIGPGAVQIHQHEFGPGGKGVLRADGAAIRGAGLDPLVKIEVLDLLSRVIIRILHIQGVFTAGRHINGGLRSRQERAELVYLALQSGYIGRVFQNLRVIYHHIHGVGLCGDGTGLESQCQHRQGLILRLQIIVLTGGKLLPVIQHAPVPFCLQGKGTVVSEGIAVRLNRKRIGASHSAEPAACKQIQERGHGLLGSPVDRKHRKVSILRNGQLIRQGRQGFYARVCQLHALILPGCPFFQIGVEIVRCDTALRCGYCVAVELIRRHRCNAMIRQRLRRGVSRVFFAEILRLEHRRRTVPGKDHRAAAATTALSPKPLLFGNIVIFFDAQSENIGRTLVLVANQSDSLVIRPGHIGWLRGRHLQYVGNRFRRTGKGHVIVLHQYIAAVQNSFIADGIHNTAGIYLAFIPAAEHIVRKIQAVQRHRLPDRAEDPGQRAVSRLYIIAEYLYVLQRSGRSIKAPEDTGRHFSRNDAVGQHRV